MIYQKGQNQVDDKKKEIAPGGTGTVLQSNLKPGKLEKKVAPRSLAWGRLKK